MKSINKIAVTTGAANGMGRETAILFLSKGYGIVCTGIDSNNLKKTVSHIKKNGGNA